MSHVLKSNWQPTASLSHLRRRSHILQIIRDFFAARHVLEVDTPLLCHTSVTDVHIQSIPAMFVMPGQEEAKTYYLQTSPEYAMKRLLAANYGAIFQLGKAFRQGEIGRYHQPEFTMLEWYRPQFDHHDLMDEMDLLLQLILNTKPAQRITYAELFYSFLSVDAHEASVKELAICADKNHLSVAAHITDRDTWLDLLMTHCIEPALGQDAPCFVYDFPASQAALSRIRPGKPALASRFEVYVQGVELANGFHELQDVNEQRKRFDNNIKERLSLGLATLPLDEYLLAALDHGLPDCAGVALGVDRLIMLATESSHISEVMSFDFSRV